MLKAFADGGVVALRADWTRQDPGITRMLGANGRAGVPLYLFYPKPGPAGDRRHAIVLPQILTAEAVLPSNTGRIGRWRRLAGRSEAPLSEAIQ